MKLLVTGASGFVGRHLVRRLLQRGHEIVAVARSEARARSLDWFDSVKFISCDLHEDFAALISISSDSDAVVHLAWPGLGNFRDLAHVKTSLPAELLFLQTLIETGTRRILVTGTCLEYGLQSGPLAEDIDTRPVTAYGLAKDCLRKSLQLLQQQKPFCLQWARLFYLHGEGQATGSLLSQLDLAVDEKREIFDMSSGHQLRDYLPVEIAADHLARIAENPNCHGTINCCSGIPVSVLDLVQERCRQRSATIQLNRGHYEIPDYEPLAFWGIPEKLHALRAEHD